jgi:hypothetical protein
VPKPDDRMGTMKSMNFRKIFFLGVLIGLGCVSAAQAQLGVYGMVSAERVKDIKCLDPQNICATNDGTVRPYGGTIGAYYDLRSYGPVRLGVDARTTFLDSNKSAYAYLGGVDIVRHYSVLGGLKATFNTPFKVLRPYAQISAGLGRTNAITPPPVFYQNFTQVQGFIGLDLALFPGVDFRAIELGDGEMFGSSSHNVQSIGIGIVFHTSRDR